MLNLSNYYLPDTHLLTDTTQKYMVWVPDSTYIVLGASNNMQDALIMENVLIDNIPVLKRPSGGQTVILTPKNLIISVVFSDDKIRPKDIFDLMNGLIIEVLKNHNVNHLSLNGISDIAIYEKKILGSSIYRTKNILFYHAVLNVSESSKTFEKYLQHPSKEPDYRKGRKHGEFITSLEDNGLVCSQDELKKALMDIFEKKLL